MHENGSALEFSQVSAQYFKFEYLIDLQEDSDMNNFKFYDISKVPKLGQRMAPQRDECD